MMTIKEIRKHLMMTQEDMAREIGCSTINISRWERGKHLPLAIYQGKIDKLAEKAACIKKAGL